MGAVEILQRPFDAKCLIHSIESAFAIDRETWLRKSEIARLRRHYDRLTPRERQVLPLVTQGLLNKQTAAELGTSEITVCVHRGQIMRKMAARSLPDLSEWWDKLGVQHSALLEYLPGNPVFKCNQSPLVRSGAELSYSLLPTPRRAGRSR